MILTSSLLRKTIRLTTPIMMFILVASTFCRAQTLFPTGYESSTSTSLRAAGRLLNQATFGPTVYDISLVEQVGIPAYVDMQLNKAAYQMESTIPVSHYSNTGGDCDGWNCDPEALWWNDVLFGQDQLRQRVAFALSKLFVVSYAEVDPRYYPYYLNKLSADAFGNWLNLMQDVTLSGAMGTYLDMANSLATAGGQADENYGRELLQLFSIGILAINPDGSLKLDANGRTIPNYTPQAIQAFGKAFTGFTFANGDCSTPATPNRYWWPQPPGTACPMVPLAADHDTTSKTLLRGTVLPPGQSAMADVVAALTNIFNDPSLPPFVSRRLIQSLVTSNPTPAYIGRVSAVFIDDGSGVRGDMKAVIRSILLDSEARADDVASAYSPLTERPDSGLMRSPVLYWTSMLRSLNAQSRSGFPWNGIYKTFDNSLADLGESPHSAPSVFSFYSPDYLLPGSTLHAPEFQLENSYALTPMTAHVQDMLNNNFRLSNTNEFSLDLSATSPLGLIASSQGPTGLVNLLSALLLHGTMTTDMRAAIVAAVTGLDSATMVKNAVFLVVTSPQYRVTI